MALDLVFVVDKISLLVVVVPPNYLLHEWIDNRSANHVFDKIGLIINRIKASPGVSEITALRCDREGAATALQDAILTKFQLNMNQSTPYGHEVLIERQVRTVRNRHRALLVRCPLPLNKTLIYNAWDCAVKTSNFIPNAKSDNKLPHQLMVGQEHYHTPPRFGQFVLVKNQAAKNFEPVNIVGMIVNFEERTRAVQVRLKNGSILVRDSYHELDDKDGLNLFFQVKGQPLVDQHPADNSSLEELNKTHEVEDSNAFLGMEPVDLSTTSSTSMDSTNNGTTTTSTMDQVQVQVQDTSSNNNNNVIGVISTMDQVQEDSEPTLELGGVEEDEIDTQSRMEVEDVEDNQDEEEEEQPTRRSTRERKSTQMPDFVYSTAKNQVGANGNDDNDDDVINAYNNLIKFIDNNKQLAKSKSRDGEQAAIKVEMAMLVKFKAIIPTRLTDPEKRKRVLKGKMVLTEKKNDNREFTHHKARFAARGDLRKGKPDPTSVYSPTASHASIMIILALILARKWSWIVLDADSAYLNADLEREEYLFLPPPLAAIMVEINSDFGGFVEQDGSMIVLIDKALYGLQESAMLWYNTLRQQLNDNGLETNPYDPALFFTGKDQSLATLLVHVDDMFGAGTEKEVINIQKGLESKFSMKSSGMCPNPINYLGLIIEFVEDEFGPCFLISQPAMVAKVTKDVDWLEEMPYKSNLFDETNPEPFPDVTLFRSKIMELNYLSKTMMEMKCAINYLSTKMQNPTMGDFDKLQHLRGYVNNNKHLRLRIDPCDDFQLYASADAAFGTYNDGKSTSGFAILIGKQNAPVLAKSTKQKSTANSSTTAEIIATATTTEEILWLTNLLESMGLEQRTVEIEQDNKSAIQLINTGPSSSGRTKWMDIKAFWTHEHVKEGKIKPVYVQSEDLLADGLTKPLTKVRFMKFRARILNMRHELANYDLE